MHNPFRRSQKPGPFDPSRPHPYQPRTTGWLDPGITPMQTLGSGSGNYQQLATAQRFGTQVCRCGKPQGDQIHEVEADA